MPEWLQAQFRLPPERLSEGNQKQQGAPIASAQGLKNKPVSARTTKLVLSCAKNTLRGKGIFDNFDVGVMSMQFLHCSDSLGLLEKASQKTDRQKAVW